MSMSEKLAKSTGRLTGRTIKVIKSAPKTTSTKTKAIKNAFIDGIEAGKPAKTKATKPAKAGKKRSEDFDEIFE